jgi:hypothetical protein
MHRRHGGPIQNRFTLPAASEGYHANDSLVKLSWETNYNRHMHDVVVYSRKGCHLCDVVKETLTHLRGDADFQWREVDVALHLNRGSWVSVLLTRPQGVVFCRSILRSPGERFGGGLPDQRRRLVARGERTAFPGCATCAG